jgi:type II secretory pathway pseudopilin PulG
MKRARKQLGFTIVETMIVLAVTGLLFLIAVDAIDGKQNEAEFQQAINDAQSQLQLAITQIQSGNYQNDDNFTCTPLGSPPGATLDITPGASGQGTNTGCLFLGKVLQFGISSNPQEFIAYPIAGLQVPNDTTGSLASEAPVAIAPGNTTNDTANFPDDSVDGYLENELSVSCVKYFTTATVPSPMCSPSAGGTPVSAMGFLSTGGTYQGSQLLSGSQQLYLVPVTPSALNTTPKAMVDAINTGLPGSPTSQNGAVQSVAICFQSGTTNQSGVVVIGGNGGDNVNSITTTIKNGVDC